MKRKKLVYLFKKINNNQKTIISPVIVNNKRKGVLTNGDQKL
jgi:hypothetical protein